MSEVVSSTLQSPKPWRESAHTQIWNVLEAVRRLPNKCMDTPQDDASLGVWLVHSPWMHPAWCWHYAGLVHLRDIPGQSKPPKLAFPGATHEFMVFAIDPACAVDPAKPDAVKFLSPVSIVQQFEANGGLDIEALARVETGLVMCTEGRMTLDSDGRSEWREFLRRKMSGGRYG